MFSTGLISTISSIFAKSIYFSLKTNRLRCMTRILGSKNISVCLDTFLRFRQLSQESSSVSGNFSSSKNLFKHSSNVTLFRFSFAGLVRLIAPAAVKLWDLWALRRLKDLYYCLDSSPSGNDNINSVSYLYLGFWHDKHVMQSPTIP